MTLSHSTVTDLFTDIASTIRSKTGSNSPIVADAFPTAINAINVMTDIDRANLGIFKGQYKYIDLSNTMSVPTEGSYCSVTQGWCDSLTNVASGAFMNRLFKNGSWTFTNVSQINNFGFCNTGIVAGDYGYVNFNFPSCKIIGIRAFSRNDILTINASRCTTIGTEAFYMCSRLTSISFPACTNIENYAFQNCSVLTSVNFSACTSIGNSAFQNCSSLATASFPACTIIKPYAFYRCQLLTSISFPACISIGSYAFASCYSLTTANLPSCTSIGSSAFALCSALSSISFPTCSVIDNYGFYKCISLVEANFPSCIKMSDLAFNNDTSLISVSFPNCTTIGTYVFASCYSLADVYLPVCKSIGQYTFGYCSQLSTVSFPSCTYIGPQAFQRCFNLLSLYLMGSSLCSLAGKDAFTSTPISDYTTSTGGVYGSIYVPASLLASYKAATNWVTYSSRFVGV